MISIHLDSYRCINEVIYFVSLQRLSLAVLPSYTICSRSNIEALLNILSMDEYADKEKYADLFSCQTCELERIYILCDDRWIESK
jgi:hypothetical protein